jgi:cell division protein ZapA
MAVITVTVNGRLYEIACSDTDAERVRHLAGDLDDRARALVDQAGPQSEARLLVMVALLLADELAEARAGLQEATAKLAAFGRNEVGLADGLTAFARRIEAIAQRLEHA